MKFWNPLLILIISLQCFPLLGQTENKFDVTVEPAGGLYSFNYYDSEVGFTGGVCNDLIQDKRGNIWAATRAGVCVLDGQGVKVYDSKDGLLSENVVSIVEGENGTFWAGTMKGLISIKKGKVKVYPYADSTHQYPQIWSVGKRPDGKILVGSQFGIGIVNNGIIEPYMILDSNNIKKNLPRFLKYDSKGILWAGCWANCHRIDDQKNILETIKTSISLGWDEADDGSIWIGSWGKHSVMRYKDSVITKYNIGTPAPSIQIDPWNQVWVSTWEKGLVKLTSDTTAIQYGVDEGLPVKSVWGGMVDHEGRVWAGTFGGGLCQLVDEKFASYSKLNGLAANLTHSVTEDQEGNIWSAANGGVSRISPNGEIKTFTEKDGLSNTLCWEVYTDNEGHVWFVLYTGKSGIYEWDGEKLIDHNYGGGFAFLQDSQGFYWMGTDGGGARRFDFKGNHKQFQEKSNKSRKRAYEIFEDSKGNIWLGAEEHGWHVVDTTGEFYSELLPPHLMKTNGDAFAEDSTGNIWLGIAGHGVFCCKYDDGKIEVLDSLGIDRGLQNNSVTDIHADKDFLWFNYAYGLVKFDLNKFYKEGEIVTTEFTTNDGFKGEGSGDIIRSKNGYLIISSSKGVLLFREELDHKLANPPFTNITDVLLNKEKVDWSEYTDSLKEGTHVPKEIKLAHDQNHLTFNFIGISYSYPEQVRYKYILEGFDSEWSPETDITQTTYSNIPPGKYIFKVKAKNKDGAWDESPDVINITISAPFWQTAWFRLLMIITGGLLVYLIFRLRMRKLKKDKKLLESKVAQRTEQLEVAYHQIEEKNIEITDSINYAKRIQAAILPSNTAISDHLDESFILYKPKDIVAGDFYWLNVSGDNILFAVADCTGHGVPGAMVSVVCHSALNRAVREFKFTEPSKILDTVRDIVLETFESSEEEVKDGMDIALCCWNKKDNRMEFSGAHNGLYLVRDGELSETKADKQPVGQFEFAKPFTNHIVDVQKGDCIYLFSDGFPDQFGGDKGKKFKYKPFKNLLVENFQKPMEEQEKILTEFFKDWKGDFEQVDDVCIIGVRI